MRRFLMIIIGIILAAGLSTGCSKKDLEAFQQNDPYPPYNLLKLFDGFPSLKDGMDSLGTQEINYGLGRMLDLGIDMPEFLSIAVELIQAPFLTEMIGELDELLGVLRDDGGVHYDDPSDDDGGFYDGSPLSMADRQEGFYAALDTVMNNTELGSDVLAIAAQVVNHMATEKTPAEIEDTMASMTGVRVYQHCMYDCVGYRAILKAGENGGPADYTFPYTVPGQNIGVFHDVSHSGVSATMSTGTYTTAQLAARGVSDNEISSIALPPGMKVTLYSDDNFAGSSVVLYCSEKNLADISFNDQTSSMIVEPVTIQSADVSSMEIPIGMKVTLLNGADSLVLTGNDRCLTDNPLGAGNWNDQATSVRVEYDLTSLAKLLGKVTMSCDYPMWVDSNHVPAMDPDPAPDDQNDRDYANFGLYTTNTDLGNAVQGVVGLLYGLNSISAAEPEVRDTLNAIIETDLPTLMGALDSATMETLIQNLSNYFAVDEDGVSVYESNSSYNSASNPYVNAAFKETVRDLFPNLVKLFIRDDGSGDADYSIFKNDDGHSPVEALTVALGKLRDIGIDYSDPVNALEPSLKRMVEYNAYGTLRSSNFALSAFDHTLFTIAAGYNFGYLTRMLAGNQASGEPFANNPSGGSPYTYQHGRSTGGILTVNDTMYSLTSNGLNVKNVYLSMTTLDVWTDSYNLALAQRYEWDDGNGNHAGQGKYVWRANDPFTPSGGASGETGDDAYEFYMGYDYPPQLLLGPGAIGDAGIPNGGQKAITPTSNATTLSVQGGTVSQNDNRTYFPKAADGKGMINTGAWMFNWIARACWDGQGPYYSTEGGATQSFNWPGEGMRTVDVYYKPNGEVYAYVYKGSDPWEYYYPTSATTGIGNDVADEDTSANGQRFNRYRDIYKSDYFAVQRGHVHARTELCFMEVSPANSRAFCVPPMNSNGSSYVEGTTGSNKFRLTAADARPAQQFWSYEKVQEWTNSNRTTGDAGYEIIGNENRECATQEEAIFRNYQWLTLEKKFIFVIPQCLFANWRAGTGLTGYTSAYLDSAAYVVIEANGLVGLANAKKGTSNGYWNIRGTEGIGADYTGHRNNPDYGNSYRPADSRIIVWAYPFSAAAPGTTTNGTIDPNVVWGLLGAGNVLPNVIGGNIAPVQRLGFVDQTDYVPSNFSTAGAMWEDRNKVLTVFAALAGVLADGTYYEPATSGSNYNYSASAGHKYPLNDFLEGIMVSLSKPLLRYWTDAQAFSGGSSSTGRWVPRIENEPSNFYYFNPINNGGSANHYRPLATLRTMMSFLAGSANNASDGLLPILTDNTQMVSRLLGLLQTLGADEYASEREEIFKGLEQLMTAMKIDKSEVISTAGRTSLDYSKYEWIFNKRNEDLDVEDFLGYEGPYRSTDDWSGFRDFLNLAKSLMGGSRDITPNLVNIMNAVLAQPLTEDQVHGLLYTVGKLFAQHEQVYPGGVWEYHGDAAGNDALLAILSTLPEVHDILADGSGGRYGLMMENMDQLLSDQDSLLYYVMENMTTSYGSEQILTDLQDFLQWPIVSEADSPLWRDLALMLEGMAGMVGNPWDINVLFDYYGFQRN